MSEPLKINIKPVKFDRHGPLYSSTEVSKCAVLFATEGQTYFRHRAKIMNQQIVEATESTEQAINGFSEKLDALIALENRFSEASRVISGKVRDTTTKMADGLAKIEKVANFDRLERYVELLERAEKAIGALAALQQTGRLEKIAASLR